MRLLLSIPYTDYFIFDLFLTLHEEARQQVTIETRLIKIHKMHIIE